jgi:hypothetical protein
MTMSSTLVALDSGGLIYYIQSHSISQQLLALDTASKTCDLKCPLLTIYLGDRAHFDTDSIQVTVNLPPIGWPLEIKMSFDDSYYFPFLFGTTSDGVPRNHCHPTLDAIFIY